MGHETPDEEGTVITSVETYALSVPLPQTIADAHDTGRVTS